MTYTTTLCIEVYRSSQLAAETGTKQFEGRAYLPVRHEAPRATHGWTYGGLYLGMPWQTVGEWDNDKNFRWLALSDPRTQQIIEEIGDPEGEKARYSDLWVTPVKAVPAMRLSSLDFYADEGWALLFDQMTEVSPHPDGGIKVHAPELHITMQAIREYAQKRAEQWVGAPITVLDVTLEKGFSEVEIVVWLDEAELEEAGLEAESRTNS